MKISWQRSSMVFFFSFFLPLLTWIGIIFVKVIQYFSANINRSLLNYFLSIIAKHWSILLYLFVSLYKFIFYKHDITERIKHDLLHSEFFSNFKFVVFQRPFLRRIWHGKYFRELKFFFKLHKSPVCLNLLPSMHVKDY